MTHEEMLKNASPRPWKANEYGRVLDRSTSTIAVNGFALSMCANDEADANTELITAAVNSYEKMREALQAARQWIAAKHDSHDNHCAFICNGGKGACDCPVPAIDAALASSEVTK